MTEDPDEPLHLDPADRTYASMARRALKLYAKGLDRRGVLWRCYGVDFPEEFFVVARQRDSSPGLMVRYTNLPWRLLTHGGASSPPAGLTEPMEQRILARDVDLVPLVELIGDCTDLDKTMLCYRLTELRAGSSAVFGVNRRDEPGDEIVYCGDSLLAVLHEHHTDYVRRVEWIVRQPWNFGFGMLDWQNVESAQRLVERVEALQREAASA